VIVGLWDMCYNKDRGVPDNLHRFYGKADKWFHGLPGVVQDLYIIGLLFYGTALDAFGLLSWHG